MSIDWWLYIDRYKIPLFHLGILFSITTQAAHAGLMNPLAKAEMIA